MDLDKETSKKIEELQILETHLQSFLGEKQSFQIELDEINNAISELEKISKDEEVYKISYNIMLKSPKDKILQDLREKKKLSEIKISSVEKQQSLIEKSIENLRQEISKIMAKKRK